MEAFSTSFLTNIDDGDEEEDLVYALRFSESERPPKKTQLLRWRQRRPEKAKVLCFEITDDRDQREKKRRGEESEVKTLK